MGIGTNREQAIKDAVDKVLRLLLEGRKKDAQIAFRALLTLLDWEDGD